MKTAILFLTKGGRRLAEHLAAHLSQASLYDCRGNLQDITERAWKHNQALIFIMAAGIVVRAISPLLEHKHKDPAVVVCDEKGKHAISLLSGHTGGANTLAQRVAGITGGEAVITTASDVLGNTAIDLWAERLGLVFEDQNALTALMGRLVNRGEISVWSDIPLPLLPHDMKQTEMPQEADLAISYRNREAIRYICQDSCLAYAPVLCAGIGCNRGTSGQAIGEALEQTFRQHALSMHSVSAIASIDIKQDEKGLVEYAEAQGLRLFFFSKEELNRVEGVSSSEAVIRATGAKGVAEPAAVLGAGGGRLIVRKIKWKDVTTAVAVASSQWWEQDQGPLT